jgi:hypothetical protein
MNRGRFLVPLVLLALVLVAAPASAQVHIGRPALGHTADGDPSILVPVTYPIEMVGHAEPLRITLRNRAGERIYHRGLRVRLSAGGLRRPERRQRFTFVHRIDLRDQPSVRLQPGLRVRLWAGSRLDANTDGVPELSATDSSEQPLTLIARRSRCSTLAAGHTRPGRRTTEQLPACTS